jgi:predicted metalloprotease with PDZ domain
LLWIYEGLTQYLGDLLAVRSGLTPTNEYLVTLAGYLGDMMRTEGRRWRALEDTAIANHILRAGSPNWGLLRRSQDYYIEGLLLWLEAAPTVRRPPFPG